MAPSNDNIVPLKGTTLFVGSWVFIANGLDGFNSHLIDPSALETSKVARRRTVDDFIDPLDEIPLPAHVTEM
jgi:hypothetical protein